MGVELRPADVVERLVLWDAVVHTSDDEVFDSTVTLWSRLGGSDGPAQARMVAWLDDV